MFFVNIALKSQGFVEVSQPSGISHAHISANLFGGGIAILDFNNDGFEDVFLTGGTKNDKLYKNNGDGTFEDVSLMAGIILTETVKTSGAVAGDINNDGFDDIFVTTESTHRNLLFMNDGNGGFQERSMESGITISNVWSTGAAMADYNQDGFLDIYVINYIKENKLIKSETGDVVGFNHVCFNNHFYINNGNGTFTESAKELNVDNDGCGLAVAFTDYNLDSSIDLYIANDFGAWVMPNTLYENNYPNNFFEDKSELSGLNCSIYGMGIAIGDINNDGLLDYYSTNIGKNVLYKNAGNNSFEDITNFAGVGNEFDGEVFATSWGANFLDYDLDGYQDLFVANGHIPSADFLKNSEQDPNKLYRNLGNDQFEDQSESEGLADLGISRGSATFDYDNDGDLDLIVTNLSRSSNATVNTLLYKNQQGENNWVKFKLAGTVSNANAIGSRVILFQSGNIKLRELTGGSSHASNNTKIIHFGLGDNKIIDSVKVTWPNGSSEIFGDIQASQTYYIAEESKHAEVMGCTNPDNAYFDPKAVYNTGCLPTTELVTSTFYTNKALFEITPNPISDHGTVRISSTGIKGGVSLIIIDTQGRIVQEYQNLNDNSELSTNKLTQGIYWYKAYDETGVIRIGKLLLK